MSANVSLGSQIKDKLVDVLHSGSSQNERPYLRANNESNVPGLYIIGDLAGAPVIKYAMAQGYEVIEHIAGLEGAKGSDPDVYDVLIIGGGASGLNAALQAKERGLKHLVLEKNKIANTIENFPEGKWVYAEPDDQPPKGKLWLDGATKEDLIARWNAIIKDNALEVRTEEGVEAVDKKHDIFNVRTSKKTYRARRVVLATGQRGNPRKLGVSGEEQECVYHRLYSPRKYKNEEILVIGGGNSAIEAAVTLSEQNKVYLSYRREEFSRIFKGNEEALKQQIAAGRIEPILNSEVVAFEKNKATLKIKDQDRSISFQHAFVLIGADVPRAFLKSIGIKMENEWEGSLLRSLGLTFVSFLGLSIFGAGVGGSGSLFGLDLSFISPTIGLVVSLAALAGLITFGVKGDRFAWLGISFFVWYSVYGAKVGTGQEFWPYQNWGYAILSFLDRPWSFWYTVLYTSLMTVFGLQALRRWGLDRQDKFQVWRYISLLSFQWIFFFLIPEFLFQVAVKYQWVGERLAADPTFADQAWRSYGIIYAWPLFFYTFFYDPHQIWVVWGVVLTFVLIPIFVLFHGKRYCSWICGCGGLAETFGDRWRHLAPKGTTSIKWEWMNLAVLIFAAVVTVFVLLKDVVAALRSPAETGIYLYRIYADIWLVGILPVTLYPFLGGKVWCRYWCPLAKMMALMSKMYAKLKWGRFKIVANDKCIACYECSRNCQVGIDVMSYALKQNVLDNETSSCIGCGICVTVCPMDTLSFGDLPQHQLTR